MSADASRTLELPLECESDERERLIVARAFANLDPIALGVAVGTVSGSALWVATTLLLLRGGADVGYHLQRLAYYLPSYTVTWPGAFLGFVEAGLIGFVLGGAVALLWNVYHRAFLSLVTARLVRRELQEL